MALPPADKNQDNWDIMQPLLANLDLIPDMSDDLRANLATISRCCSASGKVRPCSGLQTAEDIHNRLTFHNTGPEQIPGLIAMSISDTGQPANLDPNADLVLVLFNGTPDDISYTLPDALSGLTFNLHPEQAVLADSTLRGGVVDGVAQLPPRSTTVLVVAEGSADTVEEAGQEADGETAEETASTDAETTAEPADSGFPVGAAVAVGVGGATAACRWLLGLSPSRILEHALLTTGARHFA